MITKPPPFFYLPMVVLVVAAGFLIILTATIQKEVFFSGDAGLKFIMVKQIAKGGSPVSLTLQAPAWVQQVWSDGYYPFKEPFVYDAPQNKLVSFSPPFQWLSSWFYRWFGFKGIYIVPIGSLITLWLWFLLLMKRVGVKPVMIASGLVLFIFCSPLSVYGALFWEHGLAILLFFGAIAFLVTSSRSIIKAVLYGMMTGLSAWFRPEMFVMCSLVGVTVAWNYSKERNKANIIFMISMIMVLLTFLIFNKHIYGNILGAHSYQLLALADGVSYLKEKLVILLHLNVRLLIYFPLELAIVVLVLYSMIKKVPLNRLAQQLTVISILFLLITPFVLPNAGGKQWGPRYLLPVIPVFITVICIVVSQYDIKKIYWWLLGLLAPVAICSVNLNTFLAYRTLRDDYAYRVKPGMDFLRKDSAKIIVVQNQYIAQEFASVVDRKIFFLSEDQKSFNVLKGSLNANGVSVIVYISHDAGLERSSLNLISNTFPMKKIGDYYFARYDLSRK